MKIRPHHIYCYHFTSFPDPTRGKLFSETQKAIEDLWKTGLSTGQNVTVTEGPDMLCDVCPYFDGSGCTHPNGGNEGVKKWDARIMSEVDLHYDQTCSVDDINRRITEKTPLQFCTTKCPHYKSGHCKPGRK